MGTNEVKDLSEYNTLTANDIAKITGGNYRTVKRVLEKWWRMRLCHLPQLKK